MAQADNTHTDVEQHLREAILAGRLVDLRSGDTETDDPASAGKWGVRRTVTAALLADLLTRTDWPYRPRGLRLAGARITGTLDLEAAEVLCPVLLGDCWFEKPVTLAEASVPALRLPGCHMPALNAPQLTTRGNLELDEGFTVRGRVWLDGAHIGGDLLFQGATLTNNGGRALLANGLTVDQTMSCSGLCTQGEISLVGAHIGGDLLFQGATLTHPSGRALSADRLTVDQTMSCSDGFVAVGEISLIAAHTGGDLDLVGATLNNPDGLALSADGITIDGNMFCREGFAAHGGELWSKPVDEPLA